MTKIEIGREINLKKCIIFIQKLFNNGVITKEQMNIATGLCAEKLNIKKGLI
jgi:hypothetical protein